MTRPERRTRALLLLLFLIGLVGCLNHDLDELSSEYDAQSDAGPDAGSDEPAGEDCGNGVVEGGEKCDNGAPANTAVYGDRGGCTWDCRDAEYCGDGEVNGPEECDAGSDNPDSASDDYYGGCRDDCTLGAFCSSRPAAAARTRRPRSRPGRR
jgi:hypothetical protein